MRKFLFSFGMVLFGVGAFLNLRIFSLNAEMRAIDFPKVCSASMLGFEMPGEGSSSEKIKNLSMDDIGDHIKNSLISSEKAKLTKLKPVSQTTAIVGGTIIDGTGRAPIENGAILIEGSKIIAVDKRNQIELPEYTRQVDARGKYIIPGLMDGNVHLVYGISIEQLVRYEGRYEELIEEAAQITLKNGVTTVFDTWGPLQPLMNVRDRIKRGETIGSRIFVAGNIVGFSGPFGRDFNAEAEKTATKALVKRVNELWEENTGPDLQYMTAEQIRPEIRKYISRGIDFLKYASDGHQTEFQRFLMFSEGVQRAIIDECHRAGVIVQAHTSSNEGLRVAIEAGLDLVTHCDSTGPAEIADSSISILRDKKIPCGVLPETKKGYELRKKRYADDPLERRFLEIENLNIIRLIKVGIPLVLTTDGGILDPDLLAQIKDEEKVDRLTALGDGHFVWCKAMAEMGMSSMDIILAATRNVAAAYHRLDQLGTLEKGKLADLIILDADPLSDINNIRKISIVMKEGQVIEQEKLPTKKVLTIPRDNAHLKSGVS